jgi:phosphotriesterase-related protein
MARKINTALGEISTDDMGKTLHHEHLSSQVWGWQQDRKLAMHNKELRDKVIDLIVAEWIKLREVYGVRTIVDAAPAAGKAPIDMFRYVSDKSGINLIIATGLFDEEMGGLPLHWRFQTLERTTEWMIAELTEGIEGTGVKAGVIKTACSAGMSKISELDQKGMRAAARAHKATGAPLITHTPPEPEMGNAQLDLLEEEGVDLRNVDIGHRDGPRELDALMRIAQRGAFLGFDRTGTNLWEDAEDVLKVSPFGIAPGGKKVSTANLLALLKAGYEKQILISQDVTGIWLGGPTADDGTPYYGLPVRSYLTLFEKRIPQLIDAGISQETIDRILTDNPRRFFEGASSWAK